MGAGLSRHEDEVKSEILERKAQVNAQSLSNEAIPAKEGEGSSSESVSGCPMKKKDGSYTFDWGAMFRPQFPHGPTGKRPLNEEEAREKMGKPDESNTSSTTDSSSASAPASTSSNAPAGGCPVKQKDGCPVKHEHKEHNVYSQPLDPKNNMPQVANQLPSPGQTQALSTDRVRSNIPKGGANEGTTWTYPSPQMFYNALSRKGKLGDTDEQDIESVVALHNNMNEKTWRKVLEWEQVLSGDEPPKLLKFMGRPTDLSPKAMAKHYLLGHPLPYDRHDWTVLRKDGTTVRYVIDYYHDETRAVDEESSAMPSLEDTSATPSLVVDVRPALDGPTQAWNRAVTMPYARHVAKSTKFEPLPLRPTEDMRSQVQESVQVWENIQADAAEKKKGVADVSLSMPEISEKDAAVLSSNFAQALGDCRKVSERVKNAESEMDMAKARMDLSICMGKIVCPLQHGSLVEALTDESASSDDKIEAAIGNISECVYMKTGEHAAAREKFPKLFVV